MKFLFKNLRAIAQSFQGKIASNLPAEITQLITVNTHLASAHWTAINSRSEELLNQL